MKIIALTKCFLLRYRLKAKKVTWNLITYVDDNTTFEGYNKIGSRSRLYSSHIGYASYIGGATRLSNVYVGRYTSIGSNVSIVSGQHPTSTFVSTHPAFFSIKNQMGVTYVNEQLFSENRYVDSEKKYLVSIGNDAWIGNNVLLMEGIKIGDGAIVAAGAVVTKDVVPYSVVGGVPAKYIKSRFSLEDIGILLNIKWWERSEEWIRDNITAFQSIETFKDIVKNIK